MQDRILLFAPNMNKFGNKVYDGELLYLGQHLFNKGYKVTLLDCHANAEDDISQSWANIKPSIVITHLWKNEILLESRLGTLLEQIKMLKLDLGIKKVIGIGSIATSLSKEIFSYNSAIDIIIAEYGTFKRVHSMGEDEFDVIQEYFKGFVNLTDEYLQELSLGFDRDDVVSLYSSRGCTRKCSFCSYNNDIVKWKERSIKDLFFDIRRLYSRHKVTKFALFDNNFGTNIRNNEERSLDISNEVSSLNFDISLSLNISLDGLNERVLENFQRASVKGILVGLESLNETTLRNVFNKRQNLEHCIAMINFAEKIGIVPVVSYILFQPWLSLSELKLEIDRIEKFGRHRIIQFASNSKLQVIPNTDIEKKLQAEGLLIKKGLWRDFVFKDKEVEEIYLRLREFYKKNIITHNQSRASLSKLKIDEWQYLKALVGK